MGLPISRYNNETWGQLHLFGPKIMEGSEFKFWKGDKTNITINILIFSNKKKTTKQRDFMYCQTSS